MEKQKTRKKPTKAVSKILSKEEWLNKFFGEIKAFEDCVEHQRKPRDE